MFGFVFQQFLKILFAMLSMDLLFFTFYILRYQ